MDIRLISHASAVLTTQDCSIWADPWLHGKAFNESWALWPPAAMDDALFDKINYIWISHEHPDHFHIPTLRGFSESFKSRVPILFQKNNSNKMFDAIRKLGFKNVIPLPHRKLIKLTEETSVYCYQVGIMDSVLAILSDGETVFNVNDAEINAQDCKIISKDIGKVDTILNQFSIAGYSGQEDRDKYLPSMAAQVLDKFVRIHRDLSAKNSIPFASFIHYCREDNNYVNGYANSVERVASRMNMEGLGCVVLFPGDNWNTKERHKNELSLKRFTDISEDLKNCLEGEPVEIIDLSAINNVYQKRYDQIREKYWWIFRSFMKPVTVCAPDLNRNIVFSMRERRFDIKEADENCDLVINSQPFWFLFSAPYGCQTLGAMASYTLRGGFKNWIFYRILFSLNNAEIYLSLDFFTRANMIWMTQRYNGLLTQIINRIRQM